MQTRRLITASATALALCLSLSTTAAWADCGTPGQYCNGDPNHNASEQLTHAAEGISQAAEAFDGSSN
ncbi:MAG: hypothetical protein GC186_15690 [Rhodobacteraceae bacterium]|nr:hypothetical protein [Paracoccaceae bacterium]